MMMDRFYSRIMKDLSEMEAAERYTPKTMSTDGGIRSTSFDGCTYSLFSHPALKEFVELMLNIHGHLKRLFSSSDSEMILHPIWDFVTNVKCGQESLLCLMKKCDLMKCLEEDEIYNLIAFSGSFSTYLSLSFRNEHLKEIRSRIESDVISWLIKIFRFPATHGCVCDTSEDAVLHVCRHVLRLRYPDYHKAGFNALIGQAPVIYVNKNMAPRLLHHLCPQLSLPRSCICSVATEISDDFNEIIDALDLENLILQHKNEQKVPLLLIAYAGSTSTGQIDQLLTLQKICVKYDIWLHLEGNYLSTLSYLNVPMNIIPTQKANSLTLTIGTWLGLPQLPVINLLNLSDCEADASTTTTGIICCSDVQLELHSCLSLWLILQHLGHDGISRRIEYAFVLAKKINEGLEKIPSIVIMKRSDTKVNRNLENTSKKKIENFVGKMKRIIKSFLILQLPNPFIVFYYSPQKEVRNSTDSETGSKNSANDNSSREGKQCHQIQAANEWLAAQVLSRYGGGGCQVSVVEMEKIGVCMRCCSFEMDQAFRSQKNSVEEFLMFIDEKSRALDVAFEIRSQLNFALASFPNLTSVTSSVWDGVGSVRYIPDHILIDEDENKMTKWRQEINEINAEICREIRCVEISLSFDMAGEGNEHIMLGMLSSFEELLHLLQSICQSARSAQELASKPGNIL